jgi:hypothetical protein
MATKERDPEIESINSLDVRAIAERLGFERDRGEKNKYRRGDMSVNIDGQLFRSFKPGFEDVHGRGAISFAEKTLGVGFREAVRELRLVSSRPNAELSTPIPTARPSSGKKRKAPLQKPTPCLPGSETPARIYAYLCGERMIPSSLVDREMAAGRLYASDSLGGCAVFVYHDEAGNAAAYECHLLDGGRRKLFSTGSRKGEAAYRVAPPRPVRADGPSAAFFEGCIDLLSWEALNSDAAASLHLIGFGGAVTPDHPVAKLFPQSLIGFDQEPKPIVRPDGKEVWPGEEMAKPFLEKGATRLNLPTWAREAELKDWNDVLTETTRKQEEATMKPGTQNPNDKKPFNPNQARGLGVIADKNFMVLDSLNFGGRKAVSGWLDIPSQKSGIKFLAVGNVAEEIVARYEQTPPDAPLDVDFYGCLRRRTWEKDGEKHAELFLKLHSVRDAGDGQEYGLNMRIYGNIADIKDTPKGAVIRMICHEHFSETSEHETPVEFFVDGEKAESLKKAGTGAYIGLSGTIQRVGKGTGDERKYYTNVICEEVRVIPKKNKGPAQTQAPAQTAAPVRGGATAAPVRGGRTAAPATPAAPARGGRAAAPTRGGSPARTASVPARRGSSAEECDFGGQSV